MNRVASPYYPPRARWYNCFLSPLFTARRVLHLEKIHLAAGLSPFQFVLSLFVPGFAFFAFGRRMLGRSFLMAYCLAALVFVAALGYRAGNIGYGLMISAHATSVVFLQGHWLVDSRFGSKLAMALGTLFVVWLLLYAPVVGLLKRGWIMPLRVREQVVVVNRLASHKSVGRGDWIGYRIEEFRGAGVYVGAGYGLDQVFAVAGDKVQFRPEHLEVNGVKYPRQPNMPAQGEWLVPEKHWFVWPDRAISGHGRAADIYLSELMRANGMVAESKFVGKAFKQWFGRPQLP